VSHSAPETITPVTISAADSPVSSAPTSFDPNAAALPAVRFSPTRPGTPAASSLETQPVGDVTPATTYTVVKGDSLWTIAKKFHVSVAEVAAANNIKANTPVRLGQKLIIPAKSTNGHTAAAPEPAAPAAPKPATPTVATAHRPSGESVKHVVRSGETLGAIARKYQVKVGEIATANNISDPAKIRPGMELIIPGWQAPGAKSAKTPSARPPAAATTAPTPEPSSPPPSSIVTPAPEDSSATPPATEPPVIRVDDKP